MRTAIRTGNLLLLWLLCAQPPAVSQQTRCSGPLSEQQLTSLIVGKVSQRRITEEIAACGIAFPVDTASETRLKRAGATEPILAAARSKAPKASPPGEAKKAAPPDRAPDAAAPGRPPESSADLAMRAELDLWNTIKESNRTDVFEDYLRRYPQGQFTAPARARMGDLTAAALRPQVQQALRERRWDAAESRIAELTKVVAENDEIRGWRKAVSDGRAADRAAADKAASDRAETEKRRTGRDAELSRFKFEFVKIQPGEFQMGCSPGDSECFDSEKPAHRVRLTKAFEIGKYEVTQAMWESVMGSNPSNFKGADRPVEQVSWNDIQEFLRKLNQRGDGYRYRLPTEAEWEYAARAGTTGAYPVALDRAAWYDQNSGRQTHPVGQKEANAWGLYDMAGNVWEWVEDWYGGYTNTSSVDPRGPSTGQYRVWRGGSWYFVAWFARASGRVDVNPGERNYGSGFRCAREVIP